MLLFSVYKTGENNANDNLSTTRHTTAIIMLLTTSIWVWVPAIYAAYFLNFWLVPSTKSSTLVRFPSIIAMAMAAVLYSHWESCRRDNYANDTIAWGASYWVYEQT